MHFYGLKSRLEVICVLFLFAAVHKFFKPHCNSNSGKSPTVSVFLVYKKPDLISFHSNTILNGEYECFLVQ